MDDREVTELLEVMLSEDIGSGDITSAFTPNRDVKAVIRANEPGYVSGVHELQVLITAAALVSGKSMLKTGAGYVVGSGCSR